MIVCNSPCSFAAAVKALLAEFRTRTQGKIKKGVFAITQFSLGARFSSVHESSGLAPAEPVLRMRIRSIANEAPQGTFRKTRGFLNAAITHTGFRRWRLFSDSLPNDFYSELNLPR